MAMNKKKQTEEKPDLIAHRLGEQAINGMWQDLLSSKSEAEITELCTALDDSYLARAHVRPESRWMTSSTNGLIRWPAFENMPFS